MGTRGKERGRVSSKRKTEAVLRLMRGEDLDALSREIAVTAATLAQWWRREYTKAGVQEHRMRHKKPKHPRESTVP